MIKASPQLHAHNPGEIVVLPRVAAHGVADLPPPRIEDLCLTDLGLADIADLGNVVPFRRPKLTQADAPACVVSLETRPAPLPPRLSSRRFWLSLAVTLAAHALAFGVFFREPPPLASIGVEVMSVEIVVGTDSLVGKMDPTSKSEVTDVAPVEEKTADRVMQPPPVSEETKEPAQLQESVQGPAKDEPMKLAAVEPTPQPVEPPKTAEPAPQPVEPEIVPEQKVEQKIEPQPQVIVEEAPEKAVEPDKPVEQPPEKPVVAAVEPETPVKPSEIKPAEIKPAEAKPVEVKPATPVESKRPELQKKQDVKAASKSRAKPTQAPKNDRIAAAPAATQQIEARGAGIGRSDARSNFRGLVYAHLMRFKPPLSSEAAGAATVNFTLGSNGALVSGPRLAASSGNAAYDEMALSMVRRAAPFPPPGPGDDPRIIAPIKFNR